MENGRSPALEILLHDQARQLNDIIATSSVPDMEPSEQILEVTHTIGPRGERNGEKIEGNYFLRTNVIIDPYRENEVAGVSQVFGIGEGDEELVFLSFDYAPDEETSKFLDINQKAIAYVDLEVFDKDTDFAGYEGVFALLCDIQNGKEEDTILNDKLTVPRLVKQAREVVKNNLPIQAEIQYIIPKGSRYVDLRTLLLPAGEGILRKLDTGDTANKSESKVIIKEDIAGARALLPPGFSVLQSLVHATEARRNFDYCVDY